jgi:hypothetical protein
MVILKAVLKQFGVKTVDALGTFLVFSSSFVENANEILGLSF